MTRKGTIEAVLQALLGVVLLAVGANKFLGFMATPDMADPAEQFMQALAQSGYIMPLLGLTEVLVGLLLLLRLWSALALVVLAPVSVNIILFHLVLAPEAIALALVVAVLNLYLLFAYRDRYSPMLRAK